MTPVTIVTGASAGIGTELARVFARNGHALVLVARREQRLNALAAEIAKSGKPTPLVLPMDLAQAGAAARAGEALSARGLEPEYVVNNAGFGLIGAAADRDRGELLAMIDLNVRALTDLSLAFLDSLIRHRGGCSMWRPSPPSSRDRSRRSITPPRPMCCRSARRCIASSRRKACA